MQSLNKSRDVFYVSDGTAITCEKLGHAVISQFSFLPLERTFPFIETQEKLDELMAEIDKSYQRAQQKPLVFFSIVIPELADQLLTCPAFIYDVLHPLTQSVQEDLAMEAHPKLQRSHSVAKDAASYYKRIAAVEYTLSHDDGLSLKGLEKADVILLGVSRSGKTPTSLYMAMQFGLWVVNYPFIEDDMHHMRLLPELEMYRHKLYGLTIKPERLAEIRSNRYQQSVYASETQCVNEVKRVEALFRREAIPFIDTSDLSVEEISTRILQRVGIQRTAF